MAADSRQDSEVPKLWAHLVDNYAREYRAFLEACPLASRGPGVAAPAAFDAAWLAEYFSTAYAFDRRMVELISDKRALRGITRQMLADHAPKRIHVRPGAIQASSCPLPVACLPLSSAFMKDGLRCLHPAVQARPSARFFGLCRHSTGCFDRGSPSASSPWASARK